MRGLANFLRLFRRNGGSTVSVKTVAVGGGSTLTAAAVAVALLIGPWEGYHRKPYLDGANIPTACHGVTGQIITNAYNAGYVFTDEECRKLDEEALAKHERGLRAVISDNVEPKIHVFTMAALISWVYNVGNGAAAKSTLIRMVNSGDLLGACNQLSRWTRVDGKVSRGLENRRFRGDSDRISERTLCLIGIDPSYKTPLFERLILKVQP